MKFLVADDDPLVCETMESYLLRLEDTQFCLKASDGLSALRLISAGGIDAVFLDLEMPGLDGESVLRAMTSSVPVVVISASAGFAARSYEFRVTDYLLKPLEFPRVVQAVERIRERLASTKDAEPIGTNGSANEIFVKSGTRLVRLKLDQVLFLKAEGNYVEFVLEKGNVLCLMTMKRVEEIMPDGYIRAHRSYMVNWRKILKIEDNTLFIGPHRVPLGDAYRDALLCVGFESSRFDAQFIGTGRQLSDRVIAG